MQSEWLIEARERLEYDGSKLVWRPGATRVAVRSGTEAGWVALNGYRYVTIGGKSILAHRVIWEMVHGDPPARMLDHIDGDPLNNRIENLREADNALNTQNIRAPKRGNQSGFLGVHLHRQTGKYIATITVDRRSRHLGCFDDPADAHQAYLAAKRSLHAGCTI